MKQQAIHSLTVHQFVPSHSLNLFPQFISSQSLNSFPQSSQSINSFPHIRHSLNSLPHIPSDSSNSFPQFIPSQVTFPHKSHPLTSHIPSIPLTLTQIPPIHSLNPFPQSIPSQVTFPHKSRSLNSPHITSDSSNSFPQFTPQIHFLNLLLHIPSIHSLTALNSFHQFIPSFPLNWILQSPQLLNWILH